RDPELRRQHHTPHDDREGGNSTADADLDEEHEGDAEASAGDAAPARAVQGRPGDASEGGNGALQAASGEPGVRLPADAPSAADLRRPVQRADARNRAEACAVCALDQ